MHPHGDFLYSKKCHPDFHFSLANKVVSLLGDKNDKKVIEDQMKMITQNMSRIRRYVDSNAIKASERLRAPEVKANSARMRNKV